MKQLCILATLLAISLQVHAQSIKPNAFQAALGISHLSIQDLTFSPFIHTSYSPLAASLSYQRSKKLEQLITFDYATYKARIGDAFTYTSFRDSTKSYETFPHNFNRIQLLYTLGKTIRRTDQFAFAVGGRFSNRIFLSNYTFGNNGSFGYYFNFGLDAWLRGIYALPHNQTLEASLALPLFGYNSRSPYLSQDDGYFLDNYDHSGFKSFLNYVQRGEWQTWNRAQYADLEITYLKTINERWNIGARYGLSMGFNNQPTKYTFIENKLRFIATYKF